MLRRAAVTMARINMAEAPLRRFAYDLSDALSAAPRTLRQIGTAVYMQGLTGDEPGILGCQKHRGLGDLVRVRHTAERDRPRHLGDFRLAAAITWLGRVGEP